MTNLCPYCFNDKSLSRRLKEIRPKYPRSEKCTFHPNRSGLPVEAVSPLIDAVISPYYHFGDSNRYFGQDGESLEQIIYDLTDAEDDDIVNALIEQLMKDDQYDPSDGGEPFYQSDQLYVRHSNTHNPHSEAWEKFKDEITYNRRFFSDLARDRLEEIFRDVHLQKNSAGQPVVYHISPADEVQIYRARQIDDQAQQDEAVASPANKLGSPPKRLRSAGRMNAAGVAAFYGAFDLDTCIAEIRPPVGGMVISAIFQIIRPIVVLDLTRFESPIQIRSIFSPVYEARSLQWGFMQSFMHEIGQPILPNDVLLDYIPSQAVAEFIHRVLPVRIGGEKGQIEAIIFNSAQSPEGKNIVLFGDAALVREAKSGDTSTSFVKSESETFQSWDEWEWEEANPALSVSDDKVVKCCVDGVSFSHQKIASMSELSIEEQDQIIADMDI